MKLTHRLPIENWYDYDKYTKLDYPPMAGYVHYVMGMILKKLEPQVMNEAPLYSTDYLTYFQKTEVRAIIILVTCLTYYPAIIIFVSWIFSKYNMELRLYIIASLITMPMFVQMEYINIQVNSPTFGFLILSMAFALKEYKYLAAIFGIISIWFKQISMMGVIPVGIYVIAGIYHDSIKREQNKQDRWWVYFSLCFLKCMLCVLVTSAVILIPFWDKPETLTLMYSKLFPYGEREIVTTASTIWSVLRYFLRPYDDSKGRSIIFMISSFINIISVIICMLIAIRKPKNKRVFYCMFVVFTMSSYFFGYHVHEKHMCYAQLGIILGCKIFHNYMLSFSITTFFTSYFLALYNYNNLEYAWMMIINCVLICCFEISIRSSLSSSKAPLENSKESGTLLSIYKRQVKLKDRFLKVVIVIVGILLYMSMKSVHYIPFKKYIMARINLFMFDIPFVFFVYLYIHFWICLLIEIKREDKPVKKKE